ncbi:MAG: hypothetical protein Q4A83_03100 [Bacillota bacterium]|nr:hypothetical protein [Bacillota bacterium]
MLIYNQNSEKYRDVKYGKSTLGKSGCAAIASYNALEMLGMGIPLSQIISDYERQFSRGGGLLAGGRLGALPPDVRRFLKRRGFKSKGGFLRRLLRIKAPGVFIITYWNRPFIRGAHTIAVKFDGEAYTAVNYAAGLCRKRSLVEFIPDRLHFIYGFYLPKKQ